MLLAEECYKQANDLSALLLIYTSTGDRNGLEQLVQRATAAGTYNVAFAAALQLGDASSCVDTLLATDRAPEAAIFARTYAPSQASKAVRQWKKQLEGAKKTKQANAIADPSEHPDEFAEGWEEALERERAGPAIEHEQQQQEGDLVQFDDRDQDVQAPYSHAANGGSEHYEGEDEYDGAQQEQPYGIENGVAGLSLEQQQHEYAGNGEADLLGDADQGRSGAALPAKPPSKRLTEMSPPTRRHAPSRPSRERRQRGAPSGIISAAVRRRGRRFAGVKQVRSDVVEGPPLYSV